MEFSSSVIFTSSERMAAINSSRLDMVEPPSWTSSNEGNHPAVWGRTSACEHRHMACCARPASNVLMFKPVELEIELFCRGMRVDSAAGRRITRTRAGLGSGLEVVIPARPKDIWVNVPVVESFAHHSPFELH